MQILSILLIILNLQLNVDSKAQYVQPLMGGLQVAIPYDIANIWNRPVSLSPFISTFLGLSLLYILFFGVITSPFGYMFGVPSQKYVLGTDSSSSLFSAVLQAAEQWHNFNPADVAVPNPPSDESQSNGYYNDYDPYENIPRSNSHPATPVLRTILQYHYPSPDFTSSMFQFIPNSVIDSDSTSSIACQQLLLCYAHSSLRTLPPFTLPTFRVFTKILANVTEEHRLAIKTGLNGNPINCDDAFESCPSNAMSLLARILLEGLPSWLRKSIMMPQF